MTDKQLEQAISLKENIARYEKDLEILIKYKADFEYFRENVLNYFNTKSLYDPSIYQKLEYLLEQEIAACRKCIDKAKETFENI